MVQALFLVLQMAIFSLYNHLARKGEKEGKFLALFF